MTVWHLLRRNLAFHWRAHLAVLLGVAVGAAVLTGALLVGDSLRGSLRERAEAQRSGVEWALLRHQFFSATPTSGTSQAGFILRGSVSAAPGNEVRRVNNATVLAGFDLTTFAGRGEPVQGVALPNALAQQLGITAGDEFTVRVPIPATIPSESLLGQRELNQTSIELTLKLDTVLPDDHPASLFRLYPGFDSPRNVIVPIDRLRQELKGSGQHNAILATGSRQEIEQSLRQRLTLADFGLKWASHPYEAMRARPDWPRPLRRAEATRLLVPKVVAAIDTDNDGTLPPPELDRWYQSHGYLSLESDRGVIDATIADAALRAAHDAGLRAAPAFVYVANDIAAGQQSIPYSVVAALDPSLPPPFGPFLPPGSENLQDDEIVLVDWPESPLKGLQPGTTIELTFFKPELQDGRFVEERATFKLKGYVPLSGAVLDPHLTPAFPGVTDRLSVREWQPPFPYDNTRMKSRDEEYWRDYRTIPKAFVTLKAGRNLWASRYGDTTSIRLAIPSGQSWSEARQTFERRFTADAGAAAQSFYFDDLQGRFAAASRGGQDFGGLFLGFSFFLIAAALLLVGLLTRLNLERRASEIGLLLATGWQLRTVRRVLLLEVGAVAALGGVVGLIAAIGYAAGMLFLLRELWPDRNAGSLLRLHVGSISLGIGYIATLLVSAVTIFWALRWFGRIAPSALIAGHTQPGRESGERRGWWARLALPALVLCLLGGGAALVAGGQLGNPQYRAGAFFTGGFLLLAASLMIIGRWLRRPTPSSHVGQGTSALVRLGARNAQRNPARSLLTAGLLASAAFLLVAVESFRRQPEADFLKKDGGSGGCPLIVETTQPVVRDLPGEQFFDTLQRHYQDHPTGNRTPTQQVDRAKELMSQATIFSLRRSAGDDASCLNLYQAGRPVILGVPSGLIEHGGFQFVASEAAAESEQANPWLLLEKPRDDGAIPIIGEQNSLMWMLKKGLGDEIEITDEAGQPVRLRVVGILKDSVFQSELLMSAVHFKRLFPGVEGFTYHLVATDPDLVPEIESLLRLGMSQYEPELTRSTQRVAQFMAVENTYLTTFQLLGGLGLLLGALGLTVVMLRGVWERRAELALLRALGFRRSALGTLVMAENTLLLLLGLTAGVGTAILSVLPHLAVGGSIPWLRLAVLLGMVTLAGLIAGGLAVRSTLRAPLIGALRKE